MGYAEAGFDVIGVDIKPQPNYPFLFVQADAMWEMDMVNGGAGLADMPLNGEFLTFSSFDVIHASPPCQAYIQRNKNLETKHPKLIEPMRTKLDRWLSQVAYHYPGKPVAYVIENVLQEVLVEPVMLCGTFFGLSLRRHRYFEVSPPLLMSTPCNHWGTVAADNFAAVYAYGGKGHRHGAGVRDAAPAPAKVTWEEAMGIDWMTKTELSQAIPPAYTRYIGRQLMALMKFQKG